jgi:hypothetical protein
MPRAFQPPETDRNMRQNRSTASSRGCSTHLRDRINQPGAGQASTRLSTPVRHQSRKCRTLARRASPPKLVFDDCNGADPALVRRRPSRTGAQMRQ